jgi:hypothetical protein
VPFPARVALARHERHARGASTLYISAGVLLLIIIIVLLVILL